ncbi:MAG: UbiA prenyltransferase family protein [Kiritimatiellae bacterium]|nr:UbiA prenyltransferase family protein [Kiritimatiellia bacterium]
MKIWLKALRVEQWTKNAVVFAAWLFAVADPSQAALARGIRPFLLTCAMAGSFALLSSAFYLLNDVSDYEADKLHPVKRLRPIAADLISKVDAVRTALGLFSAALLFPCYLVLRHPDRTWGFAVILVYAILQFAYSGYLKRLAYVDVVVIASGFVLRAVAGAAAMDVRISPWLLACAFALSLFLALCKRKHECDVALASRAALKRYHPKTLNALIVLAAAATLGVYAAYTLAPDTAARFGSNHLAYTSVFVLLGVARYLRLVFGKADTGRPERVLLTDRTLWAILAGYGICAWVCLTI